MKQYDFDLRDYWRIIKKRKVIIILTVLIIGVFSFAFAKMQAPIPLYETAAKVKYEQSSSVAGLFIKTISFSSWDALSTQLSVVTSFPVMVDAAKKLGAVDKNLSLDEVRNREGVLKTVLSLQGSVRAEQSGNTSIIDIVATSSDPVRAQNLANATARAYRDYNIRETNKRAIEATNFIRTQVEMVKERLRQSEEQIRAFKEKNAIISTDIGSSQTASLLAQAETELEKIDSQIKTVQKHLKQIKTGGAISLESGPPPGKEEGEGPDRPDARTLAFGVEEISPNLTKLNDLLLDAHIQKRTLLMELTPHNPEVKALTRKIEGLRNEILAELNARLETLERRRKIVQERLAELRKKAGMLPEKLLTLARLQRELDLNSELYTLLNSKLQEALIQLSERVEEVTVITPAIKPTVPINPPRIVSKGVVGIIIGFILGLIFAFISETLDTSIATVEDVETYVNLPVLGIIPYLEKTPGEAKSFWRKHGVAPPEDVPGDVLMEMISHYAPKSVISESFRTLRTNIEYLCRKEDVKLFIITSSSLREGKTANSLNLAISMAQAGKKCVLIEADLRRPGIHRVFKLAREPGLSDYLMGGYQLSEVTRTINDFLLGGFTLEEITKTSGLENLHIITAGTSTINPAEILGSPQMVELMDQLKKDYDFILLDTPPVLPVADTTVLAPLVDGTLLIYQVGQIARGVLKRAKLQLENVRANIYGVILNNVRAEMSPDYYHYQMRYYYGEEVPPTKMGFLKKLWPFKRASEEGRPKSAESRSKAPQPKPPEKKGLSNTIRIVLLALAVAVLGAGLYLKYLHTPEKTAKKPKAAVQKTKKKAAAPRAVKAPEKTSRPAEKARKDAARAKKEKTAPEPEKSAAEKEPAPEPAARKNPQTPEPAPEKIAAAKDADTSSQGLYHLQLGVFSSRESSLDLAREAKRSLDFPVRVDSFTNRQGKKLFVVYLSNRVGYREGLRIGKDLFKNGFDSVVVHHRNLLGEKKIFPQPSRDEAN